MFWWRRQETSNLGHLDKEAGPSVLMFLGGDNNYTVPPERPVCSCQHKQQNNQYVRPENGVGGATLLGTS